MQLAPNPPYRSGGTIFGDITTPAGPELDIPMSIVRKLQQYAVGNAYVVKRMAAMYESGAQALFYFYLKLPSFETTGKLMNTINALSPDERTLLAEFKAKFPQLASTDFINPHRAKRVIDSVLAEVDGIAPAIVVKASVEMSRPVEEILADHYQMPLDRARDLYLEIAAESKANGWKETPQEQRVTAVKRELETAQERLRNRRSEENAYAVQRLTEELTAARAAVA